MVAARATHVAADSAGVPRHGCQADERRDAVGRAKASRSSPVAAMNSAPRGLPPPGRLRVTVAFRYSLNPTLMGASSSAISR